MKKKADDASLPAVSVNPITLVQTHPGESDADVRAAIDEILKPLRPPCPAYELRGTYRVGDTLYREFWSAAGSLHFWLKKLASEDGSRSVTYLNPNDARLESVDQTE